MDISQTQLKDFPAGFFKKSGITKKWSIVGAIRFPEVANCESLTAQIKELQEGIPKLVDADEMAINYFKNRLTKRQEEALTYGCIVSTSPLATPNKPQGSTTTVKDAAKTNVVTPELQTKKDYTLYYVLAGGAVALGITAYFTFKKN